MTKKEPEKTVYKKMQPNEVMKLLGR
jgi:hypothetical protein